MELDGNSRMRGEPWPHFWWTNFKKGVSDKKITFHTPDFSAQPHKVVVIAIYTVKMLIASSQRGLFSTECFLLTEQSLFKL
jgi:hypothetical protein